MTYNWMSDDTEAYLYRCGAAIIDNNYLLSAAHCVKTGRTDSGTGQSMYLSGIEVGTYSVRPEMGTGGMVGGTPIVNFELSPHHKNFKWFTVGYPHKNFKLG